MQMVMRSGMVELASGARLFFNEFGPTGDAVKAPPLLLLPAIGGNAELWGEFRARLGHSRATLAVDPRGFGASSNEPPIVTTRAMARDVSDLLDRIGTARVDVFGLSLGSLVATWLAVDDRARVGRLVLASCAARGPDFSPRQVLRGLRQARSLVSPGGAEREVATENASEDVPSRVRARAPSGITKDSRPRLTRYLLAMLTHAPGRRLATISAETLLLWGLRDPVLGERARKRLCRNLPRATTEVLDAGHDLTLDAPLESARRVLEFLRAPPAHVLRDALAIEP